MVPILFCVLLTTVFGGQIEYRMLGGTPVKNGTLPYVVSINDVKNHKTCLGSIISNQWILSSALCLSDAEPDDVIADVGIYKQDLQAPQRYQSTYISIHPDFDKSTGKNDIGLLRVEISIQFNDFIRPVPLGKFRIEDDGTKVMAIGWGEEEQPYQLSTVTLDALTMSQCQNKFTSLYQKVGFDDNQICSYNGKGKDLCGVDYGSPLIDSTGKQVGVFNDVIYAASGYHHECHSHHDHPLFFTKVESYSEWIGMETDIDFL